MAAAEEAAGEPVIAAAGEVAAEIEAAPAAWPPVRGIGNQGERQPAEIVLAELLAEAAGIGAVEAERQVVANPETVQPSFAWSQAEQRPAQDKLFSPWMTGTWEETFR